MEIRIRAFRKGEMYDGLQLDSLLAMAAHTGYSDKTLSKVIWMLWTGLKDMDGVDIYDGDIFKAPHDFGPGGFQWRTAVVGFDTERGYQWNFWKLDELKIIGNIHETPDLKP